MKKLSKVLVGAIIAIFGAITIMGSAMAVTCPAETKQAGADVTDLALCNTDNKSTEEAKNETKAEANKIINLIIGIVGLLAVIFIIIGAFQFTTSAGDARKTQQAKNTITYAIIGLVIALLAYAIVNFVLSKIFGV